MHVAHRTPKKHRRHQVNGSMRRAHAVSCPKPECPFPSGPGGLPACGRCIPAMLSSPCAAAVIDYHVPKNGGTTFRTLLARNAWQGRCYYSGYRWRSSDVATHLRNGSRVCVEAHVGTERFWPQVERLRSLRLTAGECSTVKIVLRIREPFSYYISFYLWRGSPGYFGRHHLVNESTFPSNLQANFISSSTIGVNRWILPPRPG